MRTKIQHLGFTLLMLTAFALSSKAEIKLPSVFGNHMVLQQQTDAAIWGSATPNKTVKLVTSWNKKSYSTKANANGNWKVKIPTPSAGGPHTISISDGKLLVLEDVLIGEVWLCSGQSNMQMPMRGFRNQPVLGSNEAVALSHNKNIRLITVGRNKTIEPQTDMAGEWLACTPENVIDFSATAYFFGRMVEQALDVPVGLICSSWSGTRIEAWMSKSSFENFDWVELPTAPLHKKASASTPTVLFNGMINPLVGLSIKGALWYQGESNRTAPDEYEKLLPGLIQNWRDLWGIGDFAFYYVQIAPFDYEEEGENSAYLREAQLKASTALPNTGMACLLDVGERNCVHPSNKEAVGERLAYWALANTYNMKGIAYSGPVLNSAKREGAMVHLTFDHAKNGLCSFGKELSNFKLGNQAGKYFNAKAFINGNRVTVFSEKVSNPYSVRYAFDDFVLGDLFNCEGLPASSFQIKVTETEE